MVLEWTKGQKIRYTKLGPGNGASVAELRSGIGDHSKSHSFTHVLPRQTSAPVWVKQWQVHQLLEN